MIFIGNNLHEQLEKQLQLILLFYAQHSAAVKCEMRLKMETIVLTENPLP
jgi:hypothetical protein